MSLAVLRPRRGLRPLICRGLCPLFWGLRPPGRQGQVHSLSRQIDGARAKDIRAKLGPRTPADLPTVKEVRKLIAAEREADGLDPDSEPRLRRSPEALKARQAERRAALTAQRQALELAQRQERMALHAAQKRESDRPFARAASAVLALIGKFPVLRSVLGPLYKNPKLNMAERHRLENEALDRRYERERKNLERRDQALGRVEAREKRSLARDQRRLDEHKLRQRQKASAQRYGEIKDNKADMTAPAAEKAKTQARQQKQGARRNRPRGFGYRRD